MRKIYSLLCVSLFLLAGTTACEDGSLSHDDVYIPEPIVLSDEDDGYSSEPTTESVIRIQMNDDKRWHQEIDGFGCSFGWAEAVYNSMKREQIMDDLYGQDGLRLNIYRGEIAGSYVDKDGNWDFALDKNYHLAPDAPEMKKYRDTRYNDEDGGMLKQLSQLWLIDYLCKKKYNDIYYFFSVWSAPGVWKVGHDKNDPLIGGSFNSEHNEIYAKFLVDFVKQYKDKFGINIYGIAGWNEPDQAMGGWAGCQWTYPQMVDFIIKNLRPELAKDERSKDSKIIYGELPWWANSIQWVDNSLTDYPELANQDIVAAGHGYSTVPSNIGKMRKAEELGIHVWQTETCDDKTRDETWNDAMKWAKNYQAYLTKANTSAIVWWAGARCCSTTGENLLQTDTWDIPSRNFYRVDRYYSIGQFSRYIQRGSVRTEVDILSTEENRLPKGLTASAYIKDDTYTIVLVNSSKNLACNALLEIEGKEFESMVSYTSSSSVKWQRKKLNPSMSGKRSVTVPKYSVVTITGRFGDKEIQTEE